ncbi:MULTISPECIES: hypothetical protein [Helicobacter]|uniref:Uncharacterized protein n=1 Tax=Helicobacter ibis TaxID=2962633 RepID=A0ABT4VC84_9HELI|nr:MULTISPECIES: hypothetical protein [Helicobacter]MDA3967555.1 hypothetical protein [Helicobacter sp. WB40]MDA3968304.1 hypothetical protein [Helicobacter ibis]
MKYYIYPKSGNGQYIKNALAILDSSAGGGGIYRLLTMKPYWI